MNSVECENVLLAKAGMRMKTRRFQTAAYGWLIILGLLMCVCGTPGWAQTAAGTSPTPDRASPCGPEPNHPTPMPIWLAYPSSGSSDVPTTVGRLIVKGIDLHEQTSSGIYLEASNGVRLALGTAHQAGALPASMPSPPADYNRWSFAEVPLPNLAPNTRYRVFDTYLDWADKPPRCFTPYSQLIGEFTTGLR